MTKIGVWEIKDNTPVRIDEKANNNLEENIETWIEKDPSIVQAGLEIIARQPYK